MQRMQKAYSNICVRRLEIAHNRLRRKRSPLTAGWGTRTLVGRAWHNRPALRDSGKNTSTHTLTHVNECVMRAAIYARGAGNRTRPTSGVRARHLPPARELAPWSARPSATDLHDVAQARIQAHVNACVRRTANYGFAFGESHAPDLRREILPLAAGSGTRLLAGRA